MWCFMSFELWESINKTSRFINENCTVYKLLFLLKIDLYLPLLERYEKPFAHESKF